MSDGPLDAPLVLVGRDYGFEEARVDRPFVGAAGKLLDRALAKVGLNRSEILITNVVNKRPAGNKWEAHSAEDIDRGLADLADTLGRHPRALLLALGAEAFQACRGRDPREPLAKEFDGNGITELRGYCFDGPFGPVLASTHPAFILRTWLPWWPCFLWDLAKAWRLLGEGKKRQYRVEFIGVVPPPEQTMLAVDIETAGPHAEEIKCVGFAWDAEMGRVQLFNEHTRDQIAEILASPVPKVFHNGQFDVTILERHGLRVNNWTDDTMNLFHVLEPLVAGRSKEKNSQTQKSLRFLASILTDEPWWKDYSFESEEDQLRLCGRDARITWQCWNLMMARLTGANLATMSPLPVMTSTLPS